MKYEDSQTCHIEESCGTSLHVTSDLTHKDEVIILDIDAVNPADLNAACLKLDVDGHVSLPVKGRFKVAFANNQH